MFEPVDDADLALAAGFGTTYFALYHALLLISQITQGKWVLVLEASSEVELVSVDLIVSMKTRVLATASNLKNIKPCCQRGAEASVDYEDKGLQSRMRELTDNTT
ncbi:hypothetical protein [Mycobacterium uberis]|uniref:hypothetical protein n=1 Tax=Mycobacterium uberis TaxID=2162698 RepID=UPI000E3088C9|nr:hypothetical protein [Mycobacterium uberis]